jgi:hypothetical protein
LARQLGAAAVRIATARTGLVQQSRTRPLLPTLDQSNPNDFFLLVWNDNDFITQSGFRGTKIL